jgi:hypothetical protein
MENQDLTIKQRKFIKYYLELGNATEAVIKAGYDVKDNESAAQIGYENLRKLDYEDFMEAAGITDSLLQQKIVEGLDANRTISANVIVKSNDPKIKTKSATARDIDFIDVPDFAIRHKYLETALKLKKRLIDRIQHSTDPENPIKVDIDVTIKKIYGSGDKKSV